MMATSEASPPDVITMTDLHFLLATDSHLQDELAEVCHLLDAYASDGLAESVYSTSSDNETTKQTIDSILEDFHTSLDEDVAPAKAPKAPRRKRKKIIDEEPLPAVGARNKFQYRQKQEILRLRKEVAELQETLATSKASTALTQNVDWEAAARRHFAESRRAMAENHQLRVAVAQQTTLIDSMKAYIHKKPIDVTSSEETWAQYKLAAQHSLRVAAIHAIADRQYGRQRSAFDKAGLLANDHEVHIARALRPHAESCVLLEFINQLRHPAPFRVIGDAIWSVMNGENGQELLLTRRRRSTSLTTTRSTNGTHKLCRQVQRFTPTRSPSSTTKTTGASSCGAMSSKTNACPTCRAAPESSSGAGRSSKTKARANANSQSFSKYRWTGATAMTWRSRKRRCSKCSLAHRRTMRRMRQVDRCTRQPPS
ncbi:hypothetical protein SPRG_08682 [Saprolegnia parasitica CBS 223.65]|uniref:Uncharacterized protein n=1 Tax=Saprolegnia parasitica (strain CBS 223.65) TaxID=695850 RepID=A0A067C5H8_SAPPC|nr:hypothetical protein SPRG_08682 [Saprolegnia parasitica CBS 223.65]KDO26029.1 hypothetical protein SPRG_08682 [Saprolegnia parasitica CBS 223.65]|eukprot:XP_012203315.1 hypothetical protein SPRG_08682 [Saprolegnia parasitica CBS 223.65]